MNNLNRTLGSMTWSIVTWPAESLKRLYGEPRKGSGPCFFANSQTGQGLEGGSLE
jgi:hypothetical protein